MDDGEREFSRVLELARRLVGEEREDYLKRECQERPDLYMEVRAELELDSALPGPNPDDSHASALMEQLARHIPQEARYHAFEQIAEGGMGAIYRVWDDDLRRTLAMKVIRSKRPEGGKGPLEMDERMLERFLEEAQVTGQLDHPGIVPVHELGVAPDGRAYFTMRLVRGQHLGEIFDLVKAGSDGWNRTRCVSVILRSSEAMAFAHAKGVVHRDLKPANIMVGRFGETYVMDWGLARIMSSDQADRSRHHQGPSSATSAVFSPWRAELERAKGSPLVTLDGEVLGTPQYMSPEQATGDLDRIGPHSDVYSLGSILYEILAGRAPYAPATGHGSIKDTLESVIKGPPVPIDRLRPGQPAELVAICEKAMARSLDRRYGGMLEMAVDLRAYLENRVVRAHQTGAVAEFKKWVSRNRTAASLAAALIVVLAVSGFAVAWVARARAEEQRQYTDRAMVTELLEEVDRLGPIHPENTAARELWLEQARLVALRSPRYFAEIERLRTLGEPGAHVDQGNVFKWDDLVEVERILAAVPGWVDSRRRTMSSPIQSELRAIAELEEEALLLERTSFELRAAELRQERGQTRPYEFADPTLQRDHDRLLRFVTDLHRLTDDGGRIARIEEDLELSRALRSRTIDDERVAWDEAIRHIGDPAVCPFYDGLEIEPQIGLVPLGEDPDSGLWEFWHVLSGAIPRMSPNGDMEFDVETGIVLVLLPGGTFVMGAQDSDPEAPGYQPSVQAREGPPREVTLAPYFISKYELTQRQWLTAAGNNPSVYLAGTSHGPGRDAEAITRMNPVENLTWEEATRVLERYGLVLPTEAQWEFASRGTLVDEPFVYTDENNFRGGDGYVLHSPVNAFPPNSFGLYGMQGNVAEFCREWYAQTYADIEVAPGDGEILGAPRGLRTLRGGTWRDTFNRSTDRRASTSLTGNVIGLRPARRLDR